MENMPKNSEDMKEYMMSEQIIDHYPLNISKVFPRYFHGDKASTDNCMKAILIDDIRQFREKLKRQNHGK